MNPNWEITPEKYLNRQELTALLLRADEIKTIGISKKRPQLIRDWMIIQIRGECRVICYHPESDKSVALMTPEEVLMIMRFPKITETPVSGARCGAPVAGAVRRAVQEVDLGSGELLA